MNHPPASHTELEIQFGQALTEVVAPEEAPYFRDIAGASAVPANTKHGDHELGFGIPGGDIGTVSAVILVLSKPILEFILDNVRDVGWQLIKDAADQVRLAFEHRVTEWIKRRFAKPLGAQLPAEKLNVLLERVKTDAAGLDLDPIATEKLVTALRHALEP